MATFTIDKRLEDAIIATLTAAAGIVAIGATVAKGFDATTARTIPDDGLVAVHCSGSSPGTLGTHKIQIADPAFISIGCFTRVSQDITGSAVQALAAAVEDVLADSAAVATLNAASAGLHIYANGLYLRDRNRDDGDAYRQITLQLEIKATVTS